ASVAPTPIYTKAFEQTAAGIANTSLNTSHPRLATGPYFTRVTFDIAPTYANLTANTGPAGAGGLRAQAYSSQGIQVGLADGGARSISPAGTVASGYGTNCLMSATTVNAGGSTMDMFSKAVFPNDNIAPQWDY